MVWLRYKKLFKQQEYFDFIDKKKIRIIIFREKI
jgi:hypothetical protein